MEYDHMMAYLESQRGTGEMPSQPKKPNFLSEKLDKTLNWFKSWIPVEPNQVVVPLDLYEKLHIKIMRANTAQTGPSQQQNDRAARELLNETGLDQVYRLQPGISGLQMSEKSNFRGRLSVNILEEREQMVIQITPKPTTKK